MSKLDKYIFLFYKRFKAEKQESSGRDARTMRIDDALLLTAKEEGLI